MNGDFDWSGLEGRAVWISCTVIGVTIIALLLHNHIANFTAAAKSLGGATAPPNGGGSAFPGGSPEINGAGNPSRAPGLSDGDDTTVIVGS